MEDNKQKIIIGVVGGLLLIILGVILFLFLGKKGATTSKGEVTLKYWGYDKEAPIQGLANAFTEKNKNIKIEYVKKGSTPEEYQKILNEAIASGEGPDLFQVRNDWVPMNYKKMAPMPENTYSEQSYKDTFFPVAYSDLSYNKEIYAIPFYIDTLALFFNQKLVDEKNVNNPGKTWTDFQKTNKILRELNGNFVNKAGIAMGTDANVLYSEDILYMLMLQNGTTMGSPDNKTAYFNLSIKDRYGNIQYPGATALDYYSTYAKPTNENYSWNASLQTSRNAFIDQKTYMFFGYASDRDIIEEATNNSLKYEVSKAPQVLGNEVYYAKYWATGVSKTSKNQEEAWKFLKFATERNNLLKYILDTNLPSARKDIAENQSGKKYSDVFVEQISKAQGWNKGNWEETDKIIREAIYSVYTNQATGQQALDKASQKITPILSETNK